MLEKVERRPVSWIPGPLYLDWRCPNCNCVVEDSKKPAWNYCPNCGTEMEET